MANSNKKKTFVIGLVGGVASGKSHIARILERLGVPKIDADSIAHEVLQRPLVARRLGQLFGSDILGSEGTAIDRNKLAKIVFGDEPESQRSRKKLEETVHPLIHAAAVHQLRLLMDTAEPPPGVVIDAPLLLEAGWAPMCDAILFVDTSKPARLARAAARGWSAEQLENREAAQMSLDDKRTQSSHVVSGELDDEALELALRKLLDQLQA